MSTKGRPSIFPLVGRAPEIQNRLLGTGGDSPCDSLQMIDRRQNVEDIFEGVVADQRWVFSNQASNRFKRTRHSAAIEIFRRHDVTFERFRLLKY
jgi:hypothetical protein